MIIDKNFSTLIENAFNHRAFDDDELRALIHGMMDGTLSEVRIASVLTGLKFIHLSDSNIFTVIEELKKNIPVYSIPENINIVDCGGTGFDGIGTVNISTASAIVAAAAGAKVAKFAGRSLSSRSGSSDVLKILNIPTAHTPEAIQAHLKSVNIAFLYSYEFYSSLKELFEIRKTLGFKTIIDLILPIATPIPLTGQLVGVFSKDSMALMMNCLVRLGRKKAMVVHSEDGMDEISVCSPSYVLKLENNKVSHELIRPSDFGISSCHLSDLYSKNLDYNAKMLVDILKNDASTVLLNAVMLNTAATLWCADIVSNLQDGFQLANVTLKSGAAYKTLLDWQKLDHHA